MSVFIQIIRSLKHITIKHILTITMLVQSWGKILRIDFLRMCQELKVSCLITSTKRIYPDIINDRHK
jgi:hypothetical protein